MLSIDATRCNGCGLCVRECISGALEMQGDRPAATAPERCNLCSHCLSVCARRAIRPPLLAAPPTLRRIQRKRLQPAAYDEIVRSRRSVRHYKPDPVPREVLAKILDLARHSPTASNAQNVHYTVISDRARLDRVSRSLFRRGDALYRIYARRPVQRLTRPFQGLAWVRSLDRYAATWPAYRALTEAGRDLVFHGAPVLLLVHARRDSGFGRDNCLIAATNVDNYAHALGLGACHNGILTTALRTDPSLSRTLEVPRGHRVHAALTLGYPAVRHTYHAVRKPASVRWVEPHTP